MCVHVSKTKKNYLFAYFDRNEKMTHCTEEHSYVLFLTNTYEIVKMAPKFVLLPSDLHACFQYYWLRERKTSYTHISHRKPVTVRQLHLKKEKKTFFSRFLSIPWLQFNESSHIFSFGL